MSATISTKAALADLLSTTCACGASKKKRQTFCRRDYFRLALGLRQALYNRIGEGYEEAYTASLDRLNLTSPAAAVEATIKRTEELFDEA